MTLQRVSISGNWLPVVALVGTLFGSVGCGAAVDTADVTDVAEDWSEPVAESSSAVTGVDVASWSDASGTVKVHLFRCDWVGPARTNSAYCSVGAGYVATGGGAEIEGEGDPGALLTGSAPFIADLTSTWRASSSDNTQAYPHRLRAYVIGLKLSGMSRLDLIHAMTWTSTSSAITNHPVSTAYAPTTQFAIGGGAYTVSPGQYLVGSSFSPGFGGWTAESKDHITAAPGKVVATAIGLDPCPTKYTGGCLGVGIDNGVHVSSGGYDLIGIGNDPATQSGLVSIGGSTTYNGAGRMLTDLYPELHPGVGGLVRTKDHLYLDSGYTLPVTLSLWKRP